MVPSSYTPQLVHRSLNGSTRCSPALSLTLRASSPSTTSTPRGSSRSSSRRSTGRSARTVHVGVDFGTFERPLRCRSRSRRRSGDRSRRVYRQRGSARTEPRRSRAPAVGARAPRGARVLRAPRSRRGAGCLLASRARGCDVLRSGSRDHVEDVAHDILGRDPLDPELGTKHEPVSKSRDRNGLDVVREDVVATLERGPAARELEEREAAARARAHRDARRRAGRDRRGRRSTRARSSATCTRSTASCMASSVSRSTTARSSTSSDARSMRRVSTSTSSSRPG